MADPKSYQEILQEQKMIEELIDLPNTDDEEKEELAMLWRDLKSREAYKFDAIIGVIKECDNCIHQFTKEMDELRGTVDYWKSKRQNVINIIKAAYQAQLISAKPTGLKYQATIKNVLPRVKDNFDKWSEAERQKFGIKKTIVVETIRDGDVIKKREDIYADKEELRQVLMDNPSVAPDEAQLVRRVSLSYGYRKRLQKGV
jgi:gas vesicle protein